MPGGWDIRKGNRASIGSSPAVATKLAAGKAASIFNAELELNSEGNVVMHFAQPDSGTNHGTSMSIQVGEILGFTTLDHIRLIWGDSDLAPSSPGWHSGMSTQLQGGALCNAADKMRKDLLSRARPDFEGGRSEIANTRWSNFVDGRPEKENNLCRVGESQ